MAVVPLQFFNPYRGAAQDLSQVGALSANLQAGLAGRALEAEAMIKRDEMAYEAAKDADRRRDRSTIRQALIGNIALAGGGATGGRQARVAAAAQGLFGQGQGNPTGQRLASSVFNMQQLQGYLGLNNQWLRSGDELTKGGVDQTGQLRPDAIPAPVQTAPSPVPDGQLPTPAAAPLQTTTTPVSAGGTNAYDEYMKHYRDSVSAVAAGGKT